MKSFLKRGLVFCLVLAVAAFPLDYVFSLCARRIHTFGMDTWRDVMGGKAAAEVIIQGNSRAFNACDYRVLDSLLTKRTAYNLVTIGNPFPVQHFRYRMYRRHNPKPRLILQFVDAITLTRYLSEYDLVQYKPWMWDKDFYRGMIPFARFRMLPFSIPVLRYHGVLPDVGVLSRRFSENGFYLPDYEVFRDTVFHPVPDVPTHFNCQEEQERAFLEFIREARREDIQVVLICPPFHESFRFKAGGKERMTAYFDSVAHACGIPFYNCIDMALDSTFFLDRDHLNMKGGRAFSDSLARYLDSLGLWPEKQAPEP